MLVSIIVPCYNEEAALPYFLKEIKKTEAELTSAFGCRFELLFIDDGSRDGTLSVLREFSKRDATVRYLSFSRNFGKEAAMYAGFCNAKGDYVAVMDADLQDPPSLLPQMFDLLESGEYDSVATRRVTRAGEPKIRSFFARRFYGLINRISDADIVDGARDYRLMRREMVDAIVAMGTDVNASITSVSTLVLFAVVPFNVLKGIVVSLVTLLLYKRVERLLRAG